MRTLSTALQNLLAADRQILWAADVYTITTRTGLVLRWSGSDRDIKFDGTTWSRGPGIDRTTVTWQVGLDGNSRITMTIYPGDVQVAGMPLDQALSSGFFDDAEVVLERAVARNAGDAVVGIVSDWFTGTIGRITGPSTARRVEVVSPLRRLDGMYPPEAFQPGCRNRLFDGMCGLNETGYSQDGTVTGSVAANRTGFTSSITLSPSTEAERFRFGQLLFTTGANAGFRATVKSYDAASGVMLFAVPWPVAIEVGDAFTVWPGCDKTRSTCAGKFFNISRFRGEPLIPSPSTTL